MGKLRETSRSSEGDELGASGSTVTDLTVLDWLVGHGVLSEIGANHLSLDFNWNPVLAGVDLSNTADHLWHDDSVTEVGLDALWLVTLLCVLDGNLDLLDKSIVLGVHSMLESSALTGLEHGDNGSGVHLEQLVDLNTSVNLFLEWLSLWWLCWCLRHGPLY